MLSLPMIGNKLKRFNHNINSLGLSRASKLFLSDHRSKLEVEGCSKSLKQIVSTKPVLLIANHEHELETVALAAALPPRNDTYAIGVQALCLLGDGFSKHIIPVYVRPESTSKSEMKLVSRIGRLLGLSTNIPQDAHEFNRKSIDRAARLLSTGALVVIFPSGARKENRWHSGVGHLISKINPAADAFIVMSRISGTSELDLLRLSSTLGRFFPPLKVKFAQPIPLNQYRQINDPKKIKAHLYQKYCQTFGLEELEYNG